MALVSARLLGTMNIQSIVESAAQEALVGC